MSLSIIKDTSPIVLGYLMDFNGKIQSSLIPVWTGGHFAILNEETRRLSLWKGKKYRNPGGLNTDRNFDKFAKEKMWTLEKVKEGKENEQFKSLFKEANASAMELVRSESQEAIIQKINLLLYLEQIEFHAEVARRDIDLVKSLHSTLITLLAEKAPFSNEHCKLVCDIVKSELLTENSDLSRIFAKYLHIGQCHVKPLEEFQIGYFSDNDEDERITKTAILLGALTIQPMLELDERILYGEYASVVIGDRPSWRVGPLLLSNKRLFTFGRIPLSPNSNFHFILYPENGKEAIQPGMDNMKIVDIKKLHITRDKWQQIVFNLRCKYIKRTVIDLGIFLPIKRKNVIDGFLPIKITLKNKPSKPSVFPPKDMKPINKRTLDLYNSMEELVKKMAQ